MKPVPHPPNGGRGLPPSMTPSDFLEGAASAAPSSPNGGRGLPPSMTPSKFLEGAASAAPSSAKTNSHPARLHPAHIPPLAHDHRSIIIFLTVCTKNRKPVLANHSVHDLLVACWKQATRWRVGRYMIMPDHLHLFASPGTFPNEPIRTWIRYWKSLASKIWLRSEERPIWQQDAWDTQLRQGESYSAKWEYVRRNPVRAGLCKTSDDWPFQGVLNVLEWHDA